MHYWLKSFFGRLNFLQGFQKTLISKRFHQVIGHIILKCIISIFLFARCENYFGRKSDLIKQFESIGTWHFHIEKNKVNRVTVQERKCIGHITEMTSDFHLAAFFTTIFQVVGGYLQIFYNNTTETHEQLLLNISNFFFSSSINCLLWNILFFSVSKSAERWSGEETVPHICSNC